MHNIEYLYESEKADRKKILNAISEKVKHETYREGGDGISNIKWFDNREPFSDYDTAREFIEKNYCGGYECVAFKFKEMKAPTKALTTTRQKMNESYKHFAELNNKVYATEFTSEFIGCKGCGSKIARKYIKSNYCPICHADMRSDTVKKQIENARNKYNELNNKVKEEEKKATEKNYEIKWLIKYEYHT